MDFGYSPRTVELQKKLTAFMEANVYPAEKAFHAEVAANRAAGDAWKPTKVVEDLKKKARAQERVKEKEKANPAARTTPIKMPTARSD